MIDWPFKISAADMPIGWNHDKKKSWNKAIDACVEAEKSGRLNVDEIESIIARWTNIPFENNQMKEIAKSIHTALYGGTKPDEQKAREE